MKFNDKILTHFAFSNLVAKKFDNEVHQLARSIPTKPSIEEVYKYFEKLESYNDKQILGKWSLMYYINVFYNLIN